MHASSFGLAVERQRRIPRAGRNVAATGDGLKEGDQFAAEFSCHHGAISGY
jgi:hypothetical protein